MRSQSWLSRVYVLFLQGCLVVPWGVEVFIVVLQKWLLFWFLTVDVKVLFGVTVVRILVLFQSFIAVAATSDVAFTGGVIFNFLCIEAANLSQFFW